MTFVSILPLLLYVPAAFEQLFREGLIALQRGDLTVAEANLKDAAKLQPKNGRVWIALSQTYWKRHDTAGAEDAAIKASALGPKDPVVLQSLVTYYSESNQILKAAETQAKLVLLNPTDLNATEHARTLYFEAVQPLLQRQDFAGAVPILIIATKSLGKDPQLQIALGVAYYGLRRFPESAEAFFTAIALAPAVKQPYLFIGRMLDQIPDRLPEAASRFTEYEQANPTAYEGYFLHAKALNIQSLEPQRSRALLERAIAIDGDYAPAHFELGVLFDRMQLYPQAASEFERAITLDPSDPAPHYRLSRIYERLGKPGQAAVQRELHRKLNEKRPAEAGRN